MQALLFRSNPSLFHFYLSHFTFQLILKYQIIVLDSPWKGQSEEQRWLALHLGSGRSNHSFWSWAPRGDAFGGTFAEVVLMLRHHPRFHELGISQQQRDVSEIIQAPKKPSSPRSTNAGGCSFPATLAER